MGKGQNRNKCDDEVTLTSLLSSQLDLSNQMAALTFRRGTPHSPATASLAKPASMLAWWSSPTDPTSLEVDDVGRLLSPWSPVTKRDEENNPSFGGEYALIKSAFTFPFRSKRGRADVRWRRVGINLGHDDFEIPRAIGRSLVRICGLAVTVAP
ncbi:hypothetical protein CSOJ01_05833 [Colletotrichum sojae]|uniref:Uncharacterized protein n=1 Tax=Colletotrichum sojae TaxID=2175907 RepID=A0A8H6JEW6_9PEZI|nr:hypothetical protein CSOJ01_05833 [Colletotrichum sojae]